MMTKKEVIKDIVLVANNSNDGGIFRTFGIFFSNVH
jgi:hypothetical protein